jgi:hypothetical protein
MPLHWLQNVVKRADETAREKAGERDDLFTTSDLEGLWRIFTFSHYQILSRVF